MIFRMWDLNFGTWISHKWIKVLKENQKHEPNIVEITHICLMHRVHTSNNIKDITYHTILDHFLHFGNTWTCILLSPWNMILIFCFSIVFGVIFGTLHLGLGGDN